MRVRPLAVAAALVLLGAGCSGKAATGTITETGREITWEATSRSLSDRLDPSSPNVCTAGRPACLDLVVAEMERRMDPLVAACDHRAVFAMTYLAVTRALRRATLAPAHGDYVRHLDAIFARLYFRAADAYDSGRRADLSASWSTAFDAAARRQVSGLGDMLAGMNAHISRDLAVATSTVGLTLADGTDAKPAFDAVTGLLAVEQGALVAEIAGRLDPTVATADVSRIQPAASTVAQVLGVWREEAWVNAGRLLASPADQRSQVELQIESVAAARALSIVAATQYIPFVTTTAERDDFCRTHAKR